MFSLPADATLNSADKRNLPQWHFNRKIKLKSCCSHKLKEKLGERERERERERYETKKFCSQAGLEPRATRQSDGMAARRSRLGHRDKSVNAWKQSYMFSWKNSGKMGKNCAKKSKQSSSKINAVVSLWHLRRPNFELAFFGAVEFFVSSLSVTFAIFLCRSWSAIFLKWQPPNVSETHKNL